MTPNAVVSRTQASRGRGHRAGVETDCGGYRPLGREHRNDDGQRGRTTREKQTFGVGRASLLYGSAQVSATCAQLFHHRRRRRRRHHHFQLVMPCRPPYFDFLSFFLVFSSDISRLLWDSCYFFSTDVSSM